MAVRQGFTVFTLHITMIKQQSHPTGVEVIKLLSQRELKTVVSVVPLLICPNLPFSIIFQIIWNTQPVNKQKAQQLIKENKIAIIYT